MQVTLIFSEKSDISYCVNRRYFFEVITAYTGEEGFIRLRERPQGVSRRLRSIILEIRIFEAGAISDVLSADISNALN
ncbi:hypothetical protein [Corynebacterium spheniscorum]|uniref:Uncharacterized protein n=1 Tax=Corynebacterium spheniscorum TaxID=185761 RepID=A0A1I2SHH4_9CORY|nr:hypothetical protein [Corynebacterium spheniscorum]SFG52234.1 hypothetical protein SAMN05660282_01140 [Corynebacterium spheniscorum]